MSIKIKQRDMTDCGAACLASVGEYYNLRIPVSRIRQIAGTDKCGTNALGMVTAAEQLGFNAKGVRGAADSLSKIPLPAIAHVVRNNFQHYIVIYSIHKQYITHMDPTDGNMHKESVEEFTKTWSGVLLLLVPGDNFKEKNDKISVRKRFWFLLQPHKSVLALSLFGAGIYTLLGLSTSIYIQKITDNVIVQGNKNLLNVLCFTMISILILRIFVGITKSVFMLNTGQKIDAQLILGYYKHLLKLPQRFFDTMRVGEIISRINDAVKIRLFINDIVISLIVNLFIVIFSFSLMFVYSWELALLLLSSIPIYILIYFVTNKLNKKRERKLMEDTAELESQLVESLNAVKTIKQFGIEDFANTKTEKRFMRLLQSVYQSSINTFFSSSASEFTSRIFTILVLWVGAGFVIDSKITTGELLSFYALISYLTNPIAGLIGMNKTIQNAMIAADRLFEIMDLERENNENTIKLQAAQIGNIRFENVSFSYGFRVNVFENFNLYLKKGELTAIIGESGSGKTTLAALMQKIYPLQSGKIFIGDQNIDYIDNSSLRQIIGSVPQQLNIFAGNVIENIAIGEFNPNIQRIIEICSMLGMMSFIEKLPAKFNTCLGENGVSLSGGQKQRLAIARTLYKNPEILILDEATSLLDSESEQFVLQTIQHLKNQGKTIVVIAHRLSTAICADRIVTLENGKIIEQGTHAELYASEGKYFQMWKKLMPEITIK